MIGFFEHQYLSYKKNHIKNLLALAKADGTVHPLEQKMLFKIGKQYGLKEPQIQALLDNEERYEVVVPDNHDDRLNILYDLMLILYADGIVDRHEIMFIEDIVGRFAMKKTAVHWLLTEVFELGIPPSPEEWIRFKSEAKKKFC
jgi:uncharacterized membrane protein YebE (DUF533 family)